MSAAAERAPKETNVVEQEKFRWLFTETAELQPQGLARVKAVEPTANEKERGGMQDLEDVRRLEDIFLYKTMKTS